MLAVSTDTWEGIFYRVEQLGLGLVYIADPEQEIIARYGLMDATLGKAVARPASFILDAEGRIAWRHLPTDWRIREGPDVYMAAYRRVQAGEIDL